NPVSKAARKKFSQSSAFRLSRGDLACRVSSDRTSMARSVLCQSDPLELRTEAAALDSARIAAQHLELCLAVAAPESDVEAVAADTEGEHRQAGQPMRQQRIDVKLPPRRVRLESQDRLQQCEDRACRPGLRYIGPEILDRKALFVTRDRRIELGELVGQEVGPCLTDIAGD